MKAVKKLIIGGKTLTFEKYTGSAADITVNS
jgi:hypothetical protein